ncbi:MAG TPA: hypothetical protein VIL65_15990 [Beijerinckiaceae bacterium]|jgi:localization factor PodJL
MRQNVFSPLDALDPGTRDLARDAARRAGLTLDEWAAAIAADNSGRAARPAPRAASAEPADTLSRTAERLARFASHEPAPRPAAPGWTRSDAAARRAEEAEGRRRLEDEARRLEQARKLEQERRREQERDDQKRDDQKREDLARREEQAKTAAALDSVARWIERAEDRLAETSRAVAEKEDRTASVLGEALGLMTRRLDEIERKIASGRQPSVGAALKAVERLEAQLARQDEARSQAQGAQIDAALRGFEARIAEISTKIGQALTERGPERSAPSGAPSASPIGRRGLDPAAELRQAIAEIRHRQDELAAGSAAAPHPANPVEAQGVAALRGDLETLRAATGRLASRDEIAGLERSLREIKGYVSVSRGQDGLLEAVATPIENLRAEVSRLSDAVADGVHARLARDLDGLARRIDAVTGHGADEAAFALLVREVAEIRRGLAERADPRRIETLADQMEELSHQLAEVGRAQAGAARFGADAFARLQATVDDLHAGMTSSRAGGTDVAQQMERLVAKLDRLSPHPGPELERLAHRLERLDERLPAAGEWTSVETLLRDLSDRIAQAERPGAGADTLDGLERQVAALAQRLDTGAAASPAVASLERAMGDLLAQVEGLRDGSVEAAERAAQAAVTTTLDRLPKEGAAVGALKRDLADLKAHQDAAGHRTQNTLDALHATLETVVARLAGLEQEIGRGAERASPRAAPPKAPRPKAPEPKPEPAAGPYPQRLEDAIKQLKATSREAQSPLDEADRPLAAAEEVLLEPGAGRPRRGAAPSAELAPGDVKANFIAAARRAAQAAAAEAAGSADPRHVQEEVLADGTNGSLAQRVKRAIDKRRRPLLLGLAAIVMALGAFQVGTTFLGEETKPVAALAPMKPVITRDAGRPAGAATVAAQPDAALAPAPAREVPTRDIVEARSSETPGRAEARVPAFLSPQAETRVMPGSVAPARPNRIEPASPTSTGALPAPAARIAGMTLVELPAEVGAPGLREAALAGDPAAVFEIAARASEGRGMNRDAKLAAKLFEKAAAGGSAPAQYRIGGMYEKGLGVTRDLNLAKAWYQRAAEKGNARAMHNLAVLLADGSGGKPDYAGAVEWFRRAAEHGVRDSQFNLGVLLARGLGATQDVGQSYTWFALAAAQGDADAAKKRDEVGAKLAAADLAKVKQGVERWRAEPLNPPANEAPAAPAQGWGEAAKAAASAEKRV